MHEQFYIKQCQNKPYRVASSRTFSENRYSPGLREMVCRLSVNDSFAPASSNLKRLAQITISSSAICGIVENQGKRILSQQSCDNFSIGFTAEDLVRIRPTESFCGCLTRLLKSCDGMADNAEAVWLLQVSIIPDNGKDTGR